MRHVVQALFRAVGKSWRVAVLLGLAARAMANDAVPRETPGDAWLDPAPVIIPPDSAPVPAEEASRVPFAQLRCDAGRWNAKVVWPKTNELSAASAVVVYSIDPPGHWAVRDWRTIPMTRNPSAWEASIPIPSTTVPVVYYLRHSVAGVTRASPARILQPDKAGIEEPSQPFTGFLDGFEQGIQGWSGGTGREPEGAISYSTNAFSGSGALRLQIPNQRSTIAAATVRLRGWMLWDFSPTALRFAARAPRGTGRLRCALVSHARTPEVQIHTSARDHEVHKDWTRIEIPLSDFPGLRWRDVDWMTFQFFDEPGADLLVDDVELVLP